MTKDRASFFLLIHIFWLHTNTILEKKSKGEQADFCTSEVQKYEEIQKSTEKFEEAQSSPRSTEVRLFQGGKSGSWILLDSIYPFGSS
jgi:hypothetical protein